MPLSKEERIEIILMAGSGSCRKVAIDFNRKHGKHITHDTVAKVIETFRKTCSVADQPRSGRPRTSTDVGTTDVVLAAFARSPQKSIRRLSAESGVSSSSIQRIVKKEKWHPYKMQMFHHLCEDDPDRRLEFCEWALNKLDGDANFTPEDPVY